MIGLRALDCQATRSGHDPAAVGLEHLSREVVRVLGGQEDRAVGDVLDLAQMAHRELADGEHRLVVRDRDVEELTARHDARVVDEDVEPTEAGQHAINHPRTWSPFATSACTASARRPSPSSSATTSLAPAALTL